MSKNVTKSTSHSINIGGLPGLLLAIPFIVFGWLVATLALLIPLLVIASPLIVLGLIVWLIVGIAS